MNTPANLKSIARYFMGVKNIFTLVLLCTLLSVASCTKDDTDTSGSQTEDGGDSGNGGGTGQGDGNETVDKGLDLRFDSSTANDLTVSISSGVYVIKTTGGDPYVKTTGLKAKNESDRVVLSFDYMASEQMDLVVYTSPAGPPTLINAGVLEKSTDWKTFTYNMSSEIKDKGWGGTNDYLRLDFGVASGLDIKVRNMYLRAQTDEEKEAEDEANAEIESLNALSKSIDKYIEASYEASISNVTVDMSAGEVSVTGTTPASGSYMLAEITPYQDITTETEFKFSYDITSGAFNIKLDRYVQRDGFDYDRLLSKWAVIKIDGSKRTLASHGRYTDDVTPSPNMPAITLASKKGIAAFDQSFATNYPNDMKDLNVHSTTLNIIIQRFFEDKASASTTPYEYGGVTYNINNARVNTINSIVSAAAKNDIKIAAILLVSPNAALCEEELAGTLLHPRYTSHGAYTMPNMTTPESVNLYAAILDFMAKTYSSSTATHMIHHWIMHNEIDAGEEWTNMGDAKTTPGNLYSDAYMKSMRMAYNIMRQYNDKSEIFASFTHFWTSSITGTSDYAPKNMMERIVDYSDVEGDFKWAIAYHSYPQDLRNPKTWEDSKATNDDNTALITFKNLEVLSRWIKKSEHKYKGTIKRSVWLSENGAHTPSYSDTDLANHAACCVYATKKLLKLDGIDAMQWHRWVDTSAGSGLSHGLRKLAASPYNGEKKPAFAAYAAMGTADEASVVDKYLSVIGVSSWDDIHYQE